MHVRRFYSVRTPAARHPLVQSQPAGAALLALQTAACTSRPCLGGRRRGRGVASGWAHRALSVPLAPGKGLAPARLRLHGNVKGLSAASPAAEGMTHSLNDSPGRPASGPLPLGASRAQLGGVTVALGAGACGPLMTVTWGVSPAYWPRVHLRLLPSPLCYGYIHVS